MFIDMINCTKQTVTINEACDIARVSRRTIYLWMEKEKIDWTRVASGSVRVIKDSLFRLNDK